MALKSGLFQEMLSVMHQFINRLMHIRQCRVFLLLFEGFVDFWAPAFGEFFEGADVDVAVMEEGVQFGHVFDQKPPVLADGVAAQRGSGFGDVFLQKCQNLGFASASEMVEALTLSIKPLLPCVPLFHLSILSSKARRFDESPALGLRCGAPSLGR